MKRLLSGCFERGEQGDTKHKTRKVHKAGHKHSLSNVSSNIQLQHGKTLTTDFMHAASPSLSEPEQKTSSGHGRCAAFATKGICCSCRAEPTGETCPAPQQPHTCGPELFVRAPGSHRSCSPLFPPTFPAVTPSLSRCPPQAGLSSPGSAA